MKKKLLVLLCFLALSGCSETVKGKATVEDAWRGQGVVSSKPTTTAPHSGAPHSGASNRPSSFDPCAYDDSVLEYYVEVDPSTKVELPGGCQWRGEGLAFTAAALPDEDVDVLAADPTVDELAELESAGRTARVFVFDDKMCMALTEIDEGLAQFMLIEDPFDPSCFNFRVVLRLLLPEL